MSLQRLFILLFLPFLCIAADQTSTDHTCTDDSECLNGGVCVKGNAAVNGIHYNVRSIVLCVLCSLLVS